MRQLACLAVLLSFVLCASPLCAQESENNMEKVNIGKKLALYPSLVTVVGAEVDGKVNWLLVAHTGIIGHSRVLISMKEDHYTNKGVIANRKLSVNLVDRAILPQADYVGTVSGAQVDKSKVFAYHMGENGTPIIDASPLSMELDVVDIYKEGGFDNFICSIAATYARKDVLDAKGQLNYNALKPVLFEFPTYSYMATGEMLGKCRRLDKAPGMCAKLPMASDGIIRLSRIEVHPEFLDEYKKYAAEVGETSLRTEPGVLTMYAAQERENPCIITILETYASQDAYKAHIASPHFQKYKQGTLKMVKDLKLIDQIPLNPDNQLTNFMTTP